MDVFQTPLEALAFNYMSFGFLATVQNFLTCVALVTAAVSFWRIRTVGSNSFHRIKSSAVDSPPVSPSPLQQFSPESEKKKETPFHHQEQACSSSSIGVGAIEYDDDMGNNSKFTLYYDGEEDPIPIARDVVIDGSEGVNVVCYYREEELYWSNDRRWSYCDGIWVGRGGDLGWYRSQDLTVLNGSVVRLWDCQRQRCSPPSGSVMAQ